MNKGKYMFIAVLGIVFISIIAIFMVEKCINESTLNDAKKFSKEYNKVSEDNVFVYSDINEILNIMKNETGIVYLGFPESKWCQSYVAILNEIAKENGIEKIYYYNIYEDRKNNTKNYQEIVSILGEYLQFDDEGNKKIYVPNVSFHIDGEIIGNDHETSFETHDIGDPVKYWTEENKNKLKKDLNVYMEEIFAYMNMCTKCDE